MHNYLIDLGRPIRFLLAGFIQDKRGHHHLDRAETDAHELFLVQKGVLNVEGNGIVSSAGPGTVLLHPQGCRQSAPATSPEEVSYYWIHFRAVLTQLPEESRHLDTLHQALDVARNMHGGSRENERRLVVPHECRPGQFGPLLNLAAEIAEKRTHFTIEKSSLIAALLSRLSADILGGKDAEFAQGKTPRRVIADIQTWIDKQVTNERQVHRLTAPRLADDFKLNPDYLNRLFKASTGVTISEHILMRKLQHAGRLLGTGMKIKEAAWLSGFANTKHFATIFRSRMRLTPSEYREKHHLVG